MKFYCRNIKKVEQKLFDNLMNMKHEEMNYKNNLVNFSYLFFHHINLISFKHHLLLVQKFEQLMKSLNMILSRISLVHQHLFH